MTGILGKIWARGMDSWAGILDLPFSSDAAALRMGQSTRLSALNSQKSRVGPLPPISFKTASCFFNAGLWVLFVGLLVSEPRGFSLLYRTKGLSYNKQDMEAAIWK